MALTEASNPGGGGGGGRGLREEGRWGDSEIKMTRMIILLCELVSLIL